MATGSEIKAAREARGLSQDTVAKAVGISQPAFKKIEDGGVARSRYMADIEQFLGLVKAEPAVTFRPAPEFFGPIDLKVYSAVEGGPGELVIETQPIDIVARPWYLQHVPDGFAVLVTGDSMTPVFRPGDLAIVNPRLPPMRGQEHIFTSGEDGGEFKATIKHLLTTTPKEWHVEQFNPPDGADKTFSLKRADWPKALRVVGSYRR